MRIRIINPVTGVSAEELVKEKAYLSKYLKTDTTVDYDTVTCGFRSIETEAQGIFNGAEILKHVIKAEADGVDGVFINCFDDPAVIAARELVEIPVLGPYVPSILTASLLGERIALITTDRYGILCEERKAAAHGFNQKINAIEYVDLGVLDLHENTLLERLRNCCLEIENKYRINIAVLGCTGMSFVAEKLKDILKKSGCTLQIIEPFRTGVVALEYIISMGYKNSIISTKINFDDLVDMGEQDLSWI